MKNVYCIVSNGEIAPGFTEAEVRANLQTLCRYRKPATLDRIFSGREVVFKTGLARPDVLRYHAALEKTGIVCRIVPVPPVPPADQERQGQIATNGRRGKKGLILAVGITLLLVVGYFGFASTLHAKGFSGVWSNEKGEFKTLSIALRRDGRGILSTAVYSAPLRWQRHDNGIEIKITLDYNVSKLFLTYDAEKDVFYFKDKSDSANVLKKISNAEPPDVEAEIVRQAEAEQEKFKVEHRMEQVVLDSRGDLLSDLRRRLLGFDGTGMYHVYVQPLSKEWQFIITYVNYNLSVSVTTLSKSVEKPSATVQGSWRAGPLPVDLPTRYLMPEANRLALEKQLAEGQYKNSKHKSVGRGLWEVETYHESISIHPDKDREKILKIIEYLICDTYGAWSGGYEVSTPVKAAH